MTTVAALRRTGAGCYDPRMSTRSIRLLTEDLDWVTPMAKAEHRTPSNMIHVLLLEARERREAAGQDQRQETSR